MKWNNESDFHPLEEKEWLYEKEFDFFRNAALFASIRLTFEGIDTIADVYLNGIHLGKTENMLTDAISKSKTRSGQARIDWKCDCWRPVLLDFIEKAEIRHPYFFTK